MTAAQQNYDASSIKILQGLDPVKLRPGQFTRTDSPLHIIQEVLDNAVDEALGGHATEIQITLLPDDGVRIADNGRGIPVGIHPESGVPVIESIFTTLYSGGKFDKTSGGSYSFAGGLHGVGVSVTNALSRKLTAEVRRDGNLHRISFSGGAVTSALEVVGPASGTGTSISVWPDPSYFDSPTFDAQALEALAKTKAVMLPTLCVVFRDERGDAPVERVYRYSDGLPTYLAELSAGEALFPPIHAEAYVGDDDGTFMAGEGAAWAFSWYPDSTPSGASFVNLIPTPQGGTHVAGLRSAIFSALRTYMEHHALVPKGLKLTADDSFKQVGYVLSVKMADPSFDNQTKDRLSHRDGVKLVERVLTPRLEGWLNQNPTLAKALAELTIRNATARQRAAIKPERKKQSSVVLLPGKLSDCESEDASLTELFLVEGDSAGGSAKMARNKEHQAILPLRGKSLNAWECDKDAALKNQEISDIATAIGIDLHSPDEELDWTKLRYGKIAILADADVDGSHIQTLLLTLFYRHFPQLVKRGHIYVSKPPLFRVDAEASGKKRPAKKLYAMDEKELKSILDKLAKEGYAEPRVGRFKGLGEMNPPDLWETTLNPDTRRLLVAVLPDELEKEASEAFSNLMGKDNSNWRKAWMERRGSEVEEF